MQAKLAAATTPPGAVDPNTRMLGILCIYKLPNGDVLPRVSQLVQGGLAERAGWMVGDLVISVDGQAMHSLTEVVLATQRGSRKKVYVLQRGEADIESTLEFAR
jgi:C-terminal processing protease CtpA/Prc